MLTRRTPLKRGKPLKRSAFKRRARKPRETDDKVYLALVRSLDCAKCGTPGPNEAHHPRDLTGMGLRAPDGDAFALCDRCHRVWLHDSGVPKEERRRFQREAVEKCRALLDFPVVLLVLLADVMQWKIRWVIVGTYTTDAEAERAWQRGRGVAARGAWWGPKEEAVKLLADPEYVPSAPSEEKSA